MGKTQLNDCENSAEPANRMPKLIQIKRCREAKLCLIHTNNELISWVKF